MNTLEDDRKTVNLLVNVAFLVDADQNIEGLCLDIPVIRLLDSSGWPIKEVRAKYLEYETIDVKVIEEP